MTPPVDYVPGIRARIARRQRRERIFWRCVFGVCSVLFVFSVLDFIRAVEDFSDRRTAAVEQVQRIGKVQP